MFCHICDCNCDRPCVYACAYVPEPEPVSEPVCPAVSASSNCDLVCFLILKTDLQLALQFIAHHRNELHRSLELPSIVMITNQPLLALTQDEQIATDNLELIKIQSAANVADILTKIIHVGEFSTKAALHCEWLCSVAYPSIRLHFTGGEISTKASLLCGWP